jgi:hypothetical protein
MRHKKAIPAKKQPFFMRFRGTSLSSLYLARGRESPSVEAIPRDELKIEKKK